MIRCILVVFLAIPLLAKGDDKTLFDKPISYDVSGSEAWSPYFMRNEDGYEYGIMPEIMIAIFKEAKIIGKPVNYPPKRTASYIYQGVLDMDIINPDWISDTSLRERFVYSEGMIEIKEFYVASPEFDYETFFNEKDIVQQSVGMVRGYYYHNQNEYVRINFPSEKALIEALNKDRIKIAISGDLPAFYWAEQLNVEVALVKLHSKGLLRLRMRKELAPLLPRLNKAINKLRDNGVIDRIIAKYVHHQFD